MDGNKGWDLDDDDLAKLRLLEHIADNGQAPNVTTLPDWAQPFGSPEYSAARTHLSEFNDLGLLDMHETGAMPSLVISGRGMTTVRKIRAERETKRARTRAVRDALLYWLDDELANHPEQPNPYVSGFTERNFAAFFGSPFTDAEIRKGLDWLAEQRYINAMKAGSEIFRVSMQPRGQDVVDREVSTQHEATPDPVPTTVHQTTNWNIGPNSQIQQGNHNTINVSNVIPADQGPTVAALIELLREIAQTNPDTPDAGPAADEIERTAQGADQGAFRRALLQGQGAVIGALTTDAGQEAVKLVHHLFGFVA